MTEAEADRLAERIAQDCAALSLPPPFIRGLVTCLEPVLIGYRELIDCRARRDV